MLPRILKPEACHLNGSTVVVGSPQRTKTAGSATAVRALSVATASELGPTSPWRLESGARLTRPPVQQRGPGLARRRLFCSPGIDQYGLARRPHFAPVGAWHGGRHDVGRQADSSGALAQLAGRRRADARQDCAPTPHITPPRWIGHQPRRGPGCLPVPSRCEGRQLPLPQVGRDHAPRPVPASMLAFRFWHAAVRLSLGWH